MPPSNKRHKLLGMLIALASLLVVSCQRIYYAPNQPQIPHLRKQGDYDVRATIGGGPEEVDFVYELQAAYSPWRYTGITAQAAFYRGEEEQTRGSAYLVELGAGGYYPLNNWIQIGSYTGYGQGQITYRQAGRTLETRTNISRSYVLPCFILGRKYAQIFGGLRIGSLHYRDTKVFAGNSLSADELSDIEYLLDRKQFTLIEPTLGLRVGWGVVSFHIQYTGLHRNIKRDDRFLSEQIMFVAGLSIHPERRRSGKKEINITVW